MYKFYEFFSPVLEVMKDQSIYSKNEVAEKVAKFFNLSEKQKSERIETGRPTYIDRTQWAMTYLKQAGALSNEKRSQWKITQRGIDLINTNNNITLDTLTQFPEYMEFKGRIGTRKKQNNSKSNLHKDTQSEMNLESFTPTELIDIALEQLNKDITKNLKDILRTIDPYRFEHICKDLLIAMGYGGNSEELSYVTRKSGDGGIDAVIKQDPLGINTIYVQAKRYQGEIKETEIRNFLGALAQKATQNGVFITTGNFSKEAIRAIQVANNMNIVPVDGEALAKLMIQYKIGVEVKNRYHTYNIDSEYFDD